MTGQPLRGRVALIEDDYTLVINRGAESGVVPGMVFGVLSESGPVITDPESGRDLGRLRRTELHVRVFDVHPLYARAHTLVRTDDFYGLLHLPFTADEDMGVVTVDVGDTVEQLPSAPPGYLGQLSHG